MPFVYANRPHIRKHGPTGYSDYTASKPWLRDDFRFRCAYCLERERWYPSGHAAFGVEHALPQGTPDYFALICDYENLLYSCNRCNSAKRDHILLDPCATSFGEHLRASDDGSITGLSVEGQHLVNCLGLDKNERRTIRQRYLRVRRLYRIHPDDPDIRALYIDHFGYPDDLPNLAKLRPESNSRPVGLTESYWRQRTEKRLPETYF